MLKSEGYNQYYNEEEKAAKRSKMKKMLIAIISILVVIVIVVLCVVFLVILKKDNNNNEVAPGYKLLRVNQNDSNAFQADLQYLGSDDYYLTNKISPIVKNISFSALFNSDNELTLRFLDSNNTRFTLPYESPFPYNKMTPNQSNNKLYELSYTTNPFSVQIKKKIDQRNHF